MSEVLLGSSVQSEKRREKEREGTKKIIQIQKKKGRTRREWDRRGERREGRAKEEKKKEKEKGKGKWKEKEKGKEKGTKNIQGEEEILLWIQQEIQIMQKWKKMIQIGILIWENNVFLKGKKKK